MNTQVAVISYVLFLPAAFGATYSISVADLASRGWIDQSGHRDGSSLGNYIVGDAGPEYRNFFLFDLSAIPANETITAASLVLYNTPYEPGGFGGCQSSDTQETYQLARIDGTSFAALRAGFSGDFAAFQDLGDGTIFGAEAFTAASTDAETAIALNSAFLIYANAERAAGREIGLGGSITSLVLVDSIGESLFPGSHAQSLGRHPSGSDHRTDSIAGIFRDLGGDSRGLHRRLSPPAHSPRPLSQTRLRFAVLARDCWLVPS